MAGKPQSPERRLATLLSRVAAGHGGCWLWTGHCLPNGYGLFCVNNKKIYAHRAAWLLMRGPIADDLHIDHLCLVRNCINPAHLEPVPQAENNAREAAVRVKCRNGHDWDEANTYRGRQGFLQCRACARDRARARTSGGRHDRASAA